MCVQLHTVLGLVPTQLSGKVDEACQETSRLSALATNLLCCHHRSIKPIQPAIQVTEENNMSLSLTAGRASLY